jgi:hypothetical protein
VSVTWAQMLVASMPDQQLMAEVVKAQEPADLDTTRLVLVAALRAVEDEQAARA